MDEKFGMGWLRDYPDFRDYTIDTDKISEKVAKLGQKDSVKAMLTKAEVTKPAKGAMKLPSSIDLRTWCSPIEDQESLGSCTANAGCGIVEYFERKAFGKHTDASRLFLYKATRNLLHWTGDKGAFLRTTMQAMVLFGMPPEEYWKYNIGSFDVEPSAFCYAYAQNYQTISYARLDPSGTPKDRLLLQIKTMLNKGIPAMFGFTVYSSIHQADKDGKIPFPSSKESVLGGHAIDAVGYDDNLKIKNQINGYETTGALIIRNSWGTGWGDKGYGYIPYEYVLKSLAVDWWILLKNEWIDSGKFE